MVACVSILFVPAIKWRIDEVIRLRSYDLATESRCQKPLKQENTCLGVYIEKLIPQKIVVVKKGIIESQSGLA